MRPLLHMRPAWQTITGVQLFRLLVGPFQHPRNVDSRHPTEKFKGGQNPSAAPDLYSVGASSCRWVHVWLPPGRGCCAMFSEQTKDHSCVELPTLPKVNSSPHCQSDIEQTANTIWDLNSAHPLILRLAVNLILLVGIF